MRLSPVFGFNSAFALHFHEDAATTVTLGGFDADGDPLRGFIRQIPGIGDLYQVTGDNRRNGTEIDLPDTEITDPKMRVIYSPVNRAVDYETVVSWDVFDGVEYSDKPGSVTLHVACDYDGDEAPIYVDCNAPGPEHDGRSWRTAYQTVQEAIDDSDSVILPIYIADGVYEECIVMKNGRKLYGGFEGYGGAELSDPEQRMWRMNQTVIDASNIDAPNHVVWMDSLTDTLLDGLIITGGEANNSTSDSVPENRGGGIYMNFCNDSNVIQNCVIRQNKARIEGGNLYCSKSSAVFRDCGILKGETLLRAAGAYLDASEISFLGCRFLENRSYAGTCVYLAAQSDARFENCVMAWNYSFEGMIYVLHASPLFINCTFADSYITSNLSTTTGIVPGIGGKAVLRNCILSGFPRFAIYEIHPHSDPVVENCLFFDNERGDYYDENSTPVPSAEEINLLTNYTGSKNSENIDGDPAFASPYYQDYHITACSEAIDMGSSTEAPLHDRDGYVRPVDIEGVGRDGGPFSFDIGAYELQKGPVLSLTPESLRFSDSPVNQPPVSARSAIISNIGVESLDLNSIYASNSGDFVIYDPSPVQSLDPCTTHTFMVGFNPSSPGRKTGRVMVDSNDPDSDEKFISVSGTGYNTPPVAGKKINPGEIKFSDADDRMTVSQYQDFPTSNITVSFWMKPEASNDAGIFSYAIGNQSKANEFLVYNQNNIRIFTTGASWTTGVSFNDGNWHHLAVTRRASDGETRLYKDGAFVTSSTLKAGYALHQDGYLVLSEDQDFLGGGYDPGQAFIGSLANMRIWNTVRTDEDILNDWKKSLHGMHPGLVGSWRFNNINGSIVYEDSAAGNRGELRNGAECIIPGTAPSGNIIDEFYTVTDEDEPTSLVLHYFDEESDECDLRIRKLPETGTLYQYGSGGRQQGEEITKPGTTVTNPENIVLYVPGNSKDSYTDMFQWDVYDGYADSENRGDYYIQVIVPKRNAWAFY